MFAAVLLGLARPSHAQTSVGTQPHGELESHSAARSRFFADVAVFAAVADPDLGESGRDIAEFNGYGSELALRLGGFTGSHVLLTGQSSVPSGDFKKPLCAGAKTRLSGVC